MLDSRKLNWTERLSVLCLALPLWWSTQAVVRSEPASPHVRIRLDQRVPMRDGVQLYADLYLPAQGERFPTLLIRLPWSTQEPFYVDWALRFASNGYAVVIEDCRGRYESEGKFRPYVDEASDGYDTHQWIGVQPWSDGNIGTFGISYNGFTQLLPAPLASPFLKALVPTQNQEDNYGHFRYNGVLQLRNSMNFLWIGDRTLQVLARQNVGMDEIHRRLPLISALDDVADRPFYREIIRHPNFDVFWKSYSMKGQYPRIQAPAFFITGWYDNLLHEQFKCFKGFKEQAGNPKARQQTKLMVGPWTHGYTIGQNPPGDVDFGTEAVMDIAAEHLRWYDQRLRGIDTGIDAEPPVRIFVMGENTWRFEEEWPPRRTQFVNYYLHSGGRANSLVGDGHLTLSVPPQEKSDWYDYDPLEPVPTLGGQSMFYDTTGPRDRRAVERRDDVLVYSTEPLAEDTEVTGSPEVLLYASSSAPDTDFTGTLVDVHPNGKAIIITEGIIRARYRDSYELPTLIEPHRIYLYKLTLWETSNLFRAGHRIRLEISSSNFPRFDRNQNSGHEPGLDAEVHVARQTIYHEAEYPSHLVLPIIPR